MEDIVKTIAGKISSYNLLNNFFPGILFCILINNGTRFSLSGDSLLENIFICYFAGIIMSRIGSLIVKKVLASIMLKKKGNPVKEPFLKMSTYENYIDASTANPLIATLSETNNLYRTLIATFFAAAIVKLYDWFLYDFLSGTFACWNEVSFVLACVILTVLFVYSYQKQTDTIRQRVEKYMGERNVGAGKKDP